MLKLSGYKHSAFYVECGAPHPDHHYSEILVAERKLEKKRLAQSLLRASEMRNPLDNRHEDYGDNNHDKNDNNSSTEPTANVCDFNETRTLADLEAKFKRTNTSEETETNTSRASALRVSGVVDGECLEESPCSHYCTTYILYIYI